MTLRDVFYIKREASPDKKEVKSILVKRGSEWHAPDYMRINTRHILFIEPVAPDSQVALLIREVETHPAAAAPQAETPPPQPQAPATHLESGDRAFSLANSCFSKANIRETRISLFPPLDHITTIVRTAGVEKP